jgi:hypothetical protein
MENSADLTQSLIVTNIAIKLYTILINFNTYPSHNMKLTISTRSMWGLII